jgi:hypothetical protein
MTAVDMARRLVELHPRIQPPRGRNCDAQPDCGVTQT